MDVWQGPKYASESLWQSWYLKGGELEHTIKK